MMVSTPNTTMAVEPLLRPPLCRKSHRCWLILAATGKPGRRRRSPLHDPPLLPPLGPWLEIAPPSCSSRLTLQEEETTEHHDLQNRFRWENRYPPVTVYR
jgi:hypothetical protein